MKGLLVGMVIGAVGMHCISDGKKSMIKKGKEKLKEKIDEMLSD